MRLLASRPAIAAALAASLGLVATPVLATPIAHGPSAPMAAALPHDVAQDRGWGGRGGSWGGRGWGGSGWNGGRGHRDGIDGGDILAGVLILGTIAAVASAASKSKRERDVYTPRSDDYRGGDTRYDNVPPPPSGERSDWGRNQSMDYVVDTCVAEVERSAAVDSVDGVSREGQGWRVSGRTRSGDPFACTLDRDGQVRGLSVNGEAPYRN